MMFKTKIPANNHKPGYWLFQEEKHGQIESSLPNQHEYHLRSPTIKNKNGS